MNDIGANMLAIVDWIVLGVVEDRVEEEEEEEEEDDIRKKIRSSDTM